MKQSKVPWWAPEVEALLLLALAACLLLPLLAALPEIQTFPYGPPLLSAAVFLTARSALNLFKKHEFLRPYKFTDAFLEKWRSKYLMVLVVAPVAVSWIQSQSFAAAWNPLGYWQSELSEAKASDCKTMHEMYVEAAEALQVTQNKYSMGIATTSEVQRNAEVFKLMKDSYENCQREIFARKNHALRMISKATQK